MENERVNVNVDDHNVRNDFLHTQHILKELELAENEANNTSIRLTHEEVFGKFREKYGYEI